MQNGALFVYSSEGHAQTREVLRLPWSDNGSIISISVQTFHFVLILTNFIRREFQKSRGLGLQHPPLDATGSPLLSDLHSGFIFFNVKRSESDHTGFGTARSWHRLIGRSLWEQNQSLLRSH